MKKKGVAILGATGSIGRQCLAVIALHSEHFTVVVLSGQRQVSLLIQQSLQYRPKEVVVVEEAYEEVKMALHPHGIRVRVGVAGLCEAVCHEHVDIVVVGLVGFSGLQPTLAAIAAKKDIALANKEVMVVAGAVVSEQAKQHGVRIYPVDSEHSAIFQCLLGEESPVHRLILTASGGPFRGRKKETLTRVCKQEALAHPVWKMGEKVSIDSATMMNKGLEVIEAKWFFGVSGEQIEVLVHPEALVHSMASFCDGTLKAQLSVPDMRAPILYALSYPKRLPLPLPSPFVNPTTLHFEPPDTDAFPCLPLAYGALRTGGNMPCVLNAANEVAVQLFIEAGIGFMDIPRLVARCMEEMPYISVPSYEDFVHTDKETRIKANEIAKAW